MRSRPELSVLLLAYGISWSIFALAKWGVLLIDLFGWTLASDLFMFDPSFCNQPSSA